MEINAVQIEMVAELRNMKNLPDRISNVEQDIARLKVIAGLAYAVFGAVLTGLVAAVLRIV
jgi:hypothetical protein